MIETLGQLFETLSSLDPSITFGSGIGLVSLGYLAYSLKKNKKNVEPSKEESEQDSRDINAITMATKNFDVDESKSSEITSYGHLDNFVKPSKDSGLKDEFKEPHTDDFTRNSVLDSSNESFSQDFPSHFRKEDIEETLNTENTNESSIPKQPEFLDQFASLDMNLKESQPISSTSIPVFENPEPLILKDINEVENDESLPSLTLPSISLENNDNKSSFVAPLPLDEKEENESSKLLKFAIESDNFGSRKDALTYLNQAVESEKELTDKVRLKIILRSYETEDKSLNDIVNSLPKIQPVQKLETPKSAGVRFVKEEDLKFVDDESNEELNEEPISSTPTTFIPDMSDLLAIPQVDIVSPVIDAHEVKNPSNPVLENGNAINQKIREVLDKTPSLVDVTFSNIDSKTSSETKGDALNVFLESLADTIEADNKLAEQHIDVENKNNQDALSHLVINEIAHKQEVLESTPSNELESKKDNQTADFSSLNFFDVNDKARPDNIAESSPVPENPSFVEQDIDQSKVWVHIIIHKESGQEFINKKFQLTHNWGTLKGNTSLNKQVSQWIKQNYSTNNFVITMVIPVQ